MAVTASISFAPVTSGADVGSETCLRIGFSEGIDSMNPLLGQTPASKVFCSLVYDCLQGVGEDLEAVPNLALDWRIAEEFEPYGSVWDFDLTENAYWHDGTPLTANDVVYTVNVMASYYVQMWPYQPYSFYIDFAEKVSDNVVRIHFYDRVSGEPIPAAYTSSIHIPIFPKHILEPWMISIGGWFPADLAPIGSGPFMVTDNITDEFACRENITLVKNPNYHWKKDMGMETRLDRIEMRFFDDAYAMALALEAGELDIAQFPPSEYLEIKDKVQDGELSDVETCDAPKCTQYWTEIAVCKGIHGSNPSRNDPAIRQAMAHAMDKQYIVDNHYLGLADPGTTLIPPINEFWHYEPTDDEIYQYDPDLAAQILEDAGYRYVSSDTVREATADSYAVLAGLVPEGTKLSYHMAIRQEYTEEQQIAQYVQGNWAEIGINITCDIMTEEALGNLVYTYNYDLMLWYRTASIDPMYSLFCQTEASFGGWNDNFYSAPTYEQNFTLSVQELDTDQRREYVHNCQRTHYLDAYYFILAYVNQTYAWRTDALTGWGDWEAHPGRSIDATWTGNVLYFELEPVEDDYTTILALAAVAAAIAVAVTVVAVRYRRKG